jgi:SAM-dependent methyltransferase
MNREEIVAGVERLKPFLLRVDLPYGLQTDGTPRLQSVLAHSWGSLLGECGGSLRGLRVMDVGCVNGGFSLEAKKAGADYVWGFDVVPHYVEQAKFLRDASGLDGVDFDVLSVEALSPAARGNFDVTLCLGVLYHMESPIAWMRRISEVTKRILFVDTNLFPFGNPKQPLWRFATVPAQNSADQDELRAGRWRTSKVGQFVPTQGAVEQLLEFLGFARVIYVEPHSASAGRYREGRTGSFIAIRA